MNGRSSHQAASSRVCAWQALVGLFERYHYAPGPAGRGEVHAHAQVQLCLSLDFPGRYRLGRRAVEVPEGSVSLVDAWEPHAVEDPIDRSIASHYDVLYVSRDEWQQAATAAARPDGAGVLVRRDPAATRAFRRLLACTRSAGTLLEQQERLRDLASALLPSIDRSSATLNGCDARLERARDFLSAYAADPISLATVARVADLGPQHFSASFRALYGVPPHRFQTLMRLDRARALLASGMPVADVASQCGFVDQSHLTRHFRRYLGFTPGRYTVRLQNIRAL